MAEIGIRENEVGQPAASEQERDAALAIAKARLNAKTRELYMAKKGHLDLAATCGTQIVALSLPAGYLQGERKTKMPEERIIETAVELTS